MKPVYLLLGGNLGNRKQTLQQATTLIAAKIGNVVQMSSIYETAPWGFEHENLFLNRVIVVETTKSPLEVLAAILAIETALGRTRTNNGWSERIIDIDILFYNESIFADADLQIPHLRLHERRFALVPLVEIAPDFVHPQLKKTLAELLLECTDKLLVNVL